MDDLVTAWAAGLFEGEGSIGPSGGWIKLQLKMCDRATVERFAVAVGGSPGRVLGPYENLMGLRDGYPRSDYFMWVSRVGESHRILRAFWPYLSDARRDRAIALGYTPGEPFAVKS